MKPPRNATEERHISREPLELFQLFRVVAQLRGRENLNRNAAAGDFAELFTDLVTHHVGGNAVLAYMPNLDGVGVSVRIVDFFSGRRLRLLGALCGSGTAASCACKHHNYCKDKSKKLLHVLFNLSIIFVSISCWLIRVSYQFRHKFVSVLIIQIFYFRLY